MVLLFLMKSKLENLIVNRKSMHKILFILLLISFVSCTKNNWLIKRHVEIDVFVFENEGKLQASAMPKIREESEFINFNRRFEYLLINFSEIHLPEKASRRNEIWNLFPDTTKLKRFYLNEFAKDEILASYFEKTSMAITDKNFEVITGYSTDELMTVASKFFYCNKVFPDTTIQSYICVGLNGIIEANFTKDYSLLAAFCFEGIFNDLDKDNSQIDEAYTYQKNEACKKYKSTITSLELYLNEVRTELFQSMKNDSVLKYKLLEYYEQNKSNLAFKIIN